MINIIRLIMVSRIEAGWLASISSYVRFISV
jgi:hypothetical protein